MGYRSDVRIITTKKGFDQLNNYVKKYLKEKGNYDYNLLDNLKFKAENDYTVYFGWNYLKWYEGYDSVDAIVDGLNHLKENNMSYRFARLGESYDDYEEESFESDLEEEQDLDYPSMLREFDDSYVIEEMNRINSVKDYQIDEM